ncbi:PucR family transcriptional regulator [Brucella tritici]|uniref:PucR family transcriptional regulator n=1 Tax=Brucella tritici TaxID=94626 RepID=UPI0020019478|nr:PucR family transcriptional regulator [Brucella tritici]
MYRELQDLSSWDYMLKLCEILNWDKLSGHTIIAGAGALAADVHSVTVIDAPDAVNWVKAHEFVVTSTYPVQQSPDALLGLVEQLAARNAAGLGVKLTRYLLEFPNDARLRAEELGFPVISLPGPLAWSDLIGKVFADGGQKGREAASLSAIYRAFSQHRRALGSLRELFELVAGFVNLPLLIAVEDETGLRVESRGISASKAETLAETLIHRAPSDTDPDDIPLRLKAGGEKVAVARSAMGPDGGGLVAVLEREEPASNVDLECLRLSAHLLQSLIDASAGTRTLMAGNARMLRDLVNPSLSREAKALIASKYMSTASPWNIVVIRIFEISDPDRSLLNLRLRQFSRRHTALMLVDDDGDECMLAIPVPQDSSRMPEAALKELQRILDGQARRSPAFRYGVGASGPSSLLRADHLRHEAKEALSFDLKLNGFNRLSRHDDVLLLRLLAHPAIIEESRASFLRLLEPLLAMGSQGLTLTDTLRIWLREDESIPRTAELLGLHVNTVRQRLERCRTVLGMNELGTDIKLRLYIALQLLPML